MDAFDADVLIYAAAPGHSLGRKVLALFAEEPLDHEEPAAGVGSLLLVPELLIKPIREDAQEEVAALAGFLSRLDLRPLDAATADLAVALGATYGLGAADGVHLATAIQAGADRFITNNQRDFPPEIVEVAITYPADLADPSSE